MGKHNDLSQKNGASAKLQPMWSDPNDELMQLKLLQKVMLVLNVSEYTVPSQFDVYVAAQLQTSQGTHADPAGIANNGLFLIKVYYLYQPVSELCLLIAVFTVLTFSKQPVFVNSFLLIIKERLWLKVHR